MFSFQHQQKGVSPRMFKSLVSRGHPEFSSNRQQDAHEFLLHMINLVEVGGAKPDFYLLLLLLLFAVIYINVYTCCSWLLKFDECNIYIGASLYTSTGTLFHKDRTEWDAAFHKTDRPLLLLLLLLFYKMTVIHPTPDTHGLAVDWEGEGLFLTVSLVGTCTCGTALTCLSKTGYIYIAQCYLLHRGTDNASFSASDMIHALTRTWHLLHLMFWRHTTSVLWTSVSQYLPPISIRPGWYIDILSLLWYHETFYGV